MRRALAVLLALVTTFPPFLVAPALASVAEEKKLGEEFRDEALAHLPTVHDHELTMYLRRMGDRLVATLGKQPFDYEFFIVNQNDINAFAVPGGKLFANAGLIARVDSDDALAGVIGHEVAHSAAHHIVRQQQKGAAAGYASVLGLLLGILNPALAIGAMAAGQAAQLQYQRDFEREADFLGVEYSRKAGYDPAAMMSLLVRLQKEMGPGQRVPPYFLSHPLTVERLTNLEAVLGRREWDASRVRASWDLQRAQAIARAYSQTREQCVPEYERKLAAASPADRPGALELLGIVLAHGEEYGTAEKVLREAEAAGRNVDRELGRVAFRRGRFEEARQRLARVLRKDPGDWDALADLAAMDVQEGKNDEAAAKLGKSVALEPYRGDVLQAYGRALGKSGREGQGFYWFGRASSLEGNSRQAAAYYKRALPLLAAGNAENERLRTDLNARLEKLGEKMQKEEAEARREQDRQGQGPGQAPLPTQRDPRTGRLR